jgi:hypothetical protein
MTDLNEVITKTLAMIERKDFDGAADYLDVQLAGRTFRQASDIAARVVAAAPEEFCEFLLARNKSA